jgi:hypothetical protein
MLAFVYSAVLGAALSWAIGGNLGSYGANYSPPVFTGKVTDDAGAPQASVRVGTLAGHFTSTDVNGDYTLAVGVAGIYSVYADVSPQRLTAMVDTNLGQTVILDFPVKTSAVFWTLYR